MKTFDYIGKTYNNCDPSSGQKQALSTDQAWGKTLSNSYSTVFSAGSKLFDSLSGKLSGIINSTNGLDAKTLAAENSQAINGAAAAAANVNRAIGEKAGVSSAVPGVESGVVQAERAGADTAIENNLNNQEAKITQDNNVLGIQERDKAIAADEALPGAAFSPSNAVGNSVTSANAQTSEQANQNAAASSSWMGLVGGLADSAVGGLTGGLMGGGKKSGGSAPSGFQDSGSGQPG